MAPQMELISAMSVESYRKPPFGQSTSTQRAKTSWLPMLTVVIRVEVRMTRKTLRCFSSPHPSLERQPLFGGGGGEGGGASSSVARRGESSSPSSSFSSWVYWLASLLRPHSPASHTRSGGGGGSSVSGR